MHVSADGGALGVVEWGDHGAVASIDPYAVLVGIEQHVDQPGRQGIRAQPHLIGDIGKALVDRTNPVRPRQPDVQPPTDSRSAGRSVRNIATSTSLCSRRQPVNASIAQPPATHQGACSSPNTEPTSVGVTTAQAPHSYWNSTSAASQGL